jgi:methionine salvage enolase-phosphatase E1
MENKEKKQVNLSKMLPIFENEGYIEYWNEEIKNKINKSVNPFQKLNLKENFSKKVNHLIESVKKSKILKLKKSVQDKHVLLRNEVYQSHLFEEIIEEIKRIMEDGIENEINEYCDNYSKGIENKKLVIQKDFTQQLGLFTEEKKIEMERRFLKLENEKFQSKNTLHYILKNKFSKKCLFIHF